MEGKLGTALCYYKRNPEAEPRILELINYLTVISRTKMDSNEIALMRIEEDIRKQVENLEAEANSRLMGIDKLADDLTTFVLLMIKKKGTFESKNDPLVLFIHEHIGRALRRTPEKFASENYSKLAAIVAESYYFFKARGIVPDDKIREEMELLYGAVVREKVEIDESIKEMLKAVLSRRLLDSYVKKEDGLVILGTEGLKPEKLYGGKISSSYVTLISDDDAYTLGPVAARNSALLCLLKNLCDDSKIQSAGTIETKEAEAVLNKLCNELGFIVFDTTIGDNDVIVEGHYPDTFSDKQRSCLMDILSSFVNCKRTFNVQHAMKEIMGELESKKPKGKTKEDL